MEYNTQRSQMLLPEYGRNVQKMIAHAMEIENKEYLPSLKSGKGNG